MRVPWTIRRSNQSILKEINPEYSLEGLMLKLKLQYFDHLMGEVNSFEKTLALSKKNCDKPRQHIKKLRQSLPTKVRLVKAMIFPVIMYGCEIDVFRCGVVPDWERSMSRLYIVTLLI